VRCDLRAPYGPASTSIPHPQGRKDPPRLVSRPNFIELCLRVTQEDEEAFKTLWRRIGLSVDWREEYTTIGERCRHLAQLSFLDLFEKGHVYSVEAPTMWDPDFQTAVAQAEVEDRPVKGAFHNVAFDVEGAVSSDRDHAARAAASVRRRDRPPKRQTIRRPLREARDHPALRCPGADFSE
jgi:valyl-tRNA synthetase